MTVRGGTKQRPSKHHGLDISDLKYSGPAFGLQDLFVARDIRKKLNFAVLFHACKFQDDSPFGQQHSSQALFQSVSAFGIRILLLPK